MKVKADSDFDADQIDHRRDAALLRALTTPPKPHQTATTKLAGATKKAKPAKRA